MRTNPRFVVRSLLAAGIALITAVSAATATTFISITGDVNDALVNDTDFDGVGNNVGDVNQPELVAGRFQDIQERAPVFPFDLPSLSGGTIVSATMTLVLQHKFGPTYSGDLYGLTRTSASSLVQTGDYFVGALDGANTKLADDLVTAGNGFFFNQALPVSGAGLISWLNAQYAAFGVNDFSGNDDFIFFRVSPDVGPGPAGTGLGQMGDGSGYSFWAANTNNVALQPLLILEVDIPVPEPTGGVLMALGLVVVWLQRRKQSASVS